MKYIQHDTSAMDDEKLTEVFIKFGYEGIGLFWSILEKIGKQEKPVKTEVLKKQLHVGKKLEKVWSFLEEIELISSNNGETFNKQLLNYAGKYQVEKEKNRERIAQWRENQKVTENVTRNKPVRNAPKVNRSKENRSKEKGECFASPAVQEVQAYFVEKGYTAEAGAKAHEYYETAGWKDSKGKQVLNWKQKMISVWFKDEHKQSGQNGKPQMVLFKNSQTGANGTMPAEQWQRVHANNPDSSLKYISNA